MPLCFVCKEGESKYKCPVCKGPYCSLGCYKQHKLECAEEPDVAQTSAPVESGTKTEPDRFERVLEDEQIQHYLSFKSLKAHLITLISIMQDPEMTEEKTKEGRRAVALIKLRELRKGGKEENELVELFVERLLELTS